MIIKKSKYLEMEGRIKKLESQLHYAKIESSVAKEQLYVTNRTLKEERSKLKEVRGILEGLNKNIRLNALGKIYSIVGDKSNDKK